MRKLIIVAVVAVVVFVGFGVGRLIWGLACELEAMKSSHAQQVDETRKLVDETRKLKGELAAERGRRQRLEEVISQRRK